MEDTGTEGSAGAQLLEVVLIAAIVGVLVFVVARPFVGPEALGWGSGPFWGRSPAMEVALAVPLAFEPGLPVVEAGTYDHAVINFSGPFRAQASVWLPTWRHVLAVNGPEILGGLLAIGVLVLLLLITRTLRRGDPFHTRNARRLLAIAGLVGIGGQCTVLLAAWGRASILARPDVGPYVMHDVSISPLPLVAGFAIAVAAEVFRRGAQLRADVEGLV